MTWHYCCLCLSFFLFSEETNPSHPWLGDQKPMDVLRTIISTVSVHVQKGGTMTTQEDVLECLRPFCADVTVSAAIKTTVLQLMEESFDLSGEDTFLLLFYQTDAIVSSTWNKKVAFFSWHSVTWKTILSYPLERVFLIDFRHNQLKSIFVFFDKGQANTFSTITVLNISQEGEIPTEILSPQWRRRCSKTDFLIAVFVDFLIALFLMSYLYSFAAHTRRHWQWR